MSLIYTPLISIALNSFVLYLLTYFVQEISYTGGFKFFLLGGIFLGVINAIVKPILKVLSLPFVVITGGLFLILINVFVLWLLSHLLDVMAFRDVTLVFQNFSTYVIGAIVLGLINWILSFIK